jgi:hypothetical protein
MVLINAIPQYIITIIVKLFFVQITVWFIPNFDLINVILVLLTVSYPVIILTEQNQRKKRRQLLIEKLKEMEKKNGKLDLKDFTYRIDKSGAPRIIERVVKVLQESDKPLDVQEIVKLVFSNYSRVITALANLFLMDKVCKLENFLDLRLKFYISKGNQHCPIIHKCNKCSNGNNG